MAVITFPLELYYHALFAKKDPLNPAFADKVISLMSRLDDDTRGMLDEHITLEEVQTAVTALRSSKTPGPDGLSGEFYKTFLALLCPVHLEIFHVAYEHQLLPPSFVHSHTVLIPKSSDPDNLEKVDGYRPIALCNVDYKIFAKVLAHRLQLVLQQVVGLHQTCGIRERRFQTNSHVARSILDGCLMSND